MQVTALREGDNTLKIEGLNLSVCLLVAKVIQTFSP